MLFYLTTLGWVRFLTDDPPAKKNGEQDKDYLIARETWNNSDDLCRHYVMNCLSDSLYDVYSAKMSVKELQESLGQKYKIEDVEAKKVFVGRCLDFKMVDFKIVISQVQEFQVILHEIQAEKIILSEDFQVATIIEKLPPRWKDFKNYLKHNRKEMSMNNLIIRLRIEEDNKRSEKRGFTPVAKENLVNHCQSSKKKKKSQVKGPS